MDLTKFLQNVTGSSTLNLPKLELQSCNPFQNASVPNKVGLAKFADLAPKIGSHSNIPSASEKKVN